MRKIEEREDTALAIALKLAITITLHNCSLKDFCI